MKFVLFVEGPTEQKAIPAFLKRWVDPRLSQPVGVKPVRFEGWAEFVDDVAKKARLYLEGPGADEVIAVIGLLDLYGPTIYPAGITAANERLAWAKPFIEKKVGHAKYRQFFAVHETEAWLLSQPSLFPRDMRPALTTKQTRPETVNFGEPPARLLDRLYTQTTRKKYKKVTYGQDLFSRLNPEQAYNACPNLKLLLDEMLALAKAAGQ